MHSQFIICPRLVGRERELELLTAAAADACHEGRAILISGEAGVGKSRLAGEAVRLARDAGFTVLSGSATEGATVPYAPMVQALRRHLRALTPDQGRPLFEGGARLAATLLPEVAAEFGTVGLGPAAPEHLDAAVFALLGHTARATPVLLLLEDLQWAGADTLRMLISVIRESRGLRLWIIGTYRESDSVRGHPLHAALGTLARERRHAEVRLGPLEAVGVRSMLDAILGPDRVDSGLVAAMTTRSLGIPFFIEELCKAAMDRAGDGGRIDLDEVVTPDTMREMLLERLRSADSESAELLLLAAVAGETVDPKILAALAGDGATAERAIQLGVERQLLVDELGTRGPRYRFRHALSREALSAELVGPERRRAHLRIAEALEIVHADHLDLVAAALADNLRRAGEPERAASHALTAARQAIAVRAPQKAALHYEQALELLPPRSPERLRILLEAAEGVLVSRDPELAAAFAERALELAATSGNRTAEAQALWIRSLDRFYAGDVRGHVDALERALELVHGTGTWHEAQALIRLARAHAILGREEVGRRLVTEAAGLAARLDRSDLKADLASARALLDQERQSLVEAVNAIGADAQGEWNHPGAHGMPARAAVETAGWVALRRGDVSLAIRAFTASVGAGPRERAPGPALAALALAEAYGGDLQAATAHGEAVGPEAGIPARVTALVALSEVALRRGNRAAVMRTARLAWELAHAFDPEGRDALARAVRAKGVLAGAGIAAAAPLFEAALPVTRTGGGLGIGHWTFAPDYARALASLARHDDLSAWVAGIEKISDAASGRGERASLLLCRGLLGAVQGDMAARPALEEAAELFGAMPAPAREAEALLALSELHWRLDDNEASARAAAQARTLADKLGSPPLLDEASVHLRRVGVRLGRRRGGRGRDNPGGLSTREIEVALLVTAGLTNSEIARRLFLSDRTVATHVSGILVKLDLRSRAEVARWATEQHLTAAPQPVG